jgi:hypothetical protein
MFDPQALAHGFILYGVLPIWIAAGFADWCCHRYSDIAQTSGATESALHLLMMAEMGIPTLAAAFFEINALVVAIMLAGFTLHELTIHADLRYTSARRDITPTEQMVHSFLELVPVVGAVLVLLFHWPAVLSLFELGNVPADWGLRLKSPAASTEQMLAIGAAGLLFVGLPYLEELYRCIRAARAAPGAKVIDL